MPTSVKTVVLGPFYRPTLCKESSSSSISPWTVQFKSTRYYYACTGLQTRPMCLCIFGPGGYIVCACMHAMYSGYEYRKLKWNRGAIPAPFTQQFVTNDQCSKHSCCTYTIRSNSLVLRKTSLKFSLIVIFRIALSVAWSNNYFYYYIPANSNHDFNVVEFLLFRMEFMNQCCSVVLLKNSVDTT